MTTNSYTGKIYTNDEYATLESKTGITFNFNDVFYLYCEKATIKIDEAEIPLINKEVIITQKTLPIYIKTNNVSGSHIVVLKFED